MRKTAYLLAFGLLSFLALPPSAPVRAYPDPPAPVPVPVVPRVTVPAEVRVAPGRMARITATTNGRFVRVVNVYSDVLDDFREYDPDPTKFAYRFLSSKEGAYRIGFYTAIDHVPSEAVYCVIVVGTPPPPVPPGPVPPVPPGPTPAPIAGDGFKVLIVYETAETSKMPKGQELVLYSQTVRDYLNAKCPVGSDSKTKEWRIFDKDVATASESKTWQDAMKRDRKSVPWIVVSNPQKGGGFEGPLPASVDEAMTLLKKYGE